MRSHRILALFAIVLVALAAPAAQNKDAPAGQFAKKREELLIEIGQRHLEYGLELRKQGLPTQAAAQIVLAVDTSQGKNPGANMVLSMMRQYDDAFWKRHGSRPSKSKLEGYDKRSAKLLLDDEKERLELANWGQARKLEREAREEYYDLLRARNAPLAFDAKGQITLPTGTIPEAPSKAIREAAITINGKLYVRDEILEKLPDVKELFETASEELLVRTTSTQEHAAALHALCAQLLPELEKDTGARPERRLTLYAFAARATYETLLDGLGLAGHKIVSGIALSSPPLALVCLEGADEVTVHGLCLHELTHHHCHAVSRAVFPDWYSEAYADTFGGTDTFRWDGTKLVVGGPIARSRIDALKADGGTVKLRDLLATQGLDTWKKGKDAGLGFYAQSWAFLRFLRSGAGEAIARRLELW